MRILGIFFSFQPVGNSHLSCYSEPVPSPVYSVKISSGSFFTTFEIPVQSFCQRLLGTVKREGEVEGEGGVGKALTH